MRPLLRTGDILFLQSKRGLISRLIRWGQGNDARISHVAPIINSAGDLVEANPKGVERTNLWTRYADKLHCVAIYRPFRITEQQRGDFISACLNRIGTPYGYITIVQHLIDNKIFGGRRVLRSIDLPWMEICSEEASKVYASLGWTFGGADEPQSMYDWVVAHPEVYANVFTLGEIN